MFGAAVVLLTGDGVCVTLLVVSRGFAVKAIDWGPQPEAVITQRQLIWASCLPCLTGDFYLSASATTRTTIIPVLHN